MRSSASVTLSLLASQAIASTGTLDSTDDTTLGLVNNVESVSDVSASAVVASTAVEEATAAIATNSVYQTNAIAYSVVEGSIIATESESIITNTYNSRLVQTSNVVSQVAQQYADQPSYTIVTTDEQGRTTTEYKWWVPASTATAEQSVTDLSPEASSVTYSPLSVTIPTARSFSSSVVEEDEEISSVSTASSDSTTSTWAYGPVTTVTSVDANGNDYTSTLWWVPSTTYTWAGESSVDASVKTVESVYVSTSNSKRVTRTSTYETTMLNKAKETGSKNSTVSVHSNSTNGIDHLTALNGLKYVALAAFLL